MIEVIVVCFDLELYLFVRIETHTHLLKCTMRIFGVFQISIFFVDGVRFLQSVQDHHSVSSRVSSRVNSSMQSSIVINE